jgi:DNA polymerase bacteriophage-type
MTVPSVHLDIETRSTVDIKRGVYAYATGAEVILWQWAVDDGEVVIEEGPRPSADLLYYLHSPDVPLVAHNATFERVLIRATNRLVLDPHRWHCTMARAMAHGLPGGLESLGEIFGLPEDKAKIKEGRRLIRLFCVPKKDGTFTQPAEKPADWALFREYAARDVIAMRELYKKMPNWNYPAAPAEKYLYCLDQQINDRGFAIDEELARAALDACAEAKRVSAEEVSTATAGAVGAVTERDKLLGYLLEACGVKLPDMRADTLERRLNDESLPTEVRALIEMRLEIAQTSTAKYQKMLDCAVGGRLRGTLQFCGARRTRRWAGRIVQPHNFARPTLDWEDIEAGIEALKLGVADPATATTLASNTLRPTIVAPENKQLAIADLANIEGRTLAWEAHEEWKLAAFRAFDMGVGPDLYIASYAAAFGADPDEVTKPQRQIGKVLELSMGYEGGVGAFAAMAAVYGMDLDETAASALPALAPDVLREADYFWGWAKTQKRTYGMTRETFVALDALKRAWRRAHPNTVDYWADVKKAAIRAIESGRPAAAGPLTFDMVGAWLRMKLPSGGYLCYPGARVEEDGGISYLGINQYTHQWGRIRTYGGKLVENATQAIARDVLANGLVLSVNAGFCPVLTVHDELITEEPIEFPLRDHKFLSKLMSTQPSWAPDLPLAAAGFTAPRYRKD